MFEKTRLMIFMRSRSLECGAHTSCSGGGGAIYQGKKKNVHKATGRMCRCGIGFDMLGGPRSMDLKNQKGLRNG